MKSFEQYLKSNFERDRPVRSEARLNLSRLKLNYFQKFVLGYGSHIKIIKINYILYVTCV